LDFNAPHRNGRKKPVAKDAKEIPCLTGYTKKKVHCEVWVERRVKGL